MSREWNKTSIKGKITTACVGDHISINGGELLIEVVDAKGKWIRLAFNAGKDISINRLVGAHKNACKIDSCDLCGYIEYKQSRKGEQQNAAE